MARIGIIGTGWGARVQVPTFREACLSVVAIAGHNRMRTRTVAASSAFARRRHGVRWRLPRGRSRVDRDPAVRASQR